MAQNRNRAWRSAVGRFVHIDPYNLRRAIAIGLCWIIAIPYANHLRADLPQAQGLAAFVAVLVAAAFITSKIEVERPVASEAR